MKKPPKIRCAIYTRKSTEEGLDQEFNSLDAQRVAAEAYIQSQIHEGWELIPTHYDDGGFSGGNMQRPALKKLLDDIEAKKVDVVIVYKVDRLSRALNDFAKMVELFDTHEVSFVSVTQQFNTTTSMGRLTLNVLLSFAQFEREVTGERIRDKFAASKKKGMWMGGPLTLGYDLDNRKLLVNETEAGQVKFIFEKYLEIREVKALADYLSKHGYKTKSWTKQNGEVAGGTDFTKNSLRKLLSNPLYIGRIRHKEKTYEGEQDAIIDQELWQQIQDLLKENATKRKSKKNQNHEVLFKGKVYDPTGELFTSTYTRRGSKRYHYYLNKRSNCRISVPELNAIVTNSLVELDLSKVDLDMNSLTNAEISQRYILAVGDIAKAAVDKIVIEESKLSILLNKRKLESLIEGSEFSCADKAETIEVIAYITFRRYAGRKIAYSADGNAISISRTNHDHALVRAMARSHKWNKMLESGEVVTRNEIAKLERVDQDYVGDILQLKYLAPEIVTMILKGTQPRTLKVFHLTKQKLPTCWDEQKTLLNIA